jgi:hypothetical protein
MRILLKNGCETSRCLVCDRWSNDESDSVIVRIVVTVTAVPLVVNDHIVQDNVSTYDQLKSALRIRPVRNDWYIESLL